MQYLAKEAMDQVTQQDVSVAQTLAGLSDSELLDLDRLELTDSPALLEDVAQRAPVVRLVHAILLEAYRKRASDIHLEPTKQGVSLRYRIDGILYDQQAPPKALFPALISRIKILSGLNIAEKRLPQDGRIRFPLGETELDIRVATVPSICGESVSLRLLDTSNQVRSLAELGLSSYDLHRLHQVFSYTHGLVLVTGPTGGGKTTTLYAMLEALRSAERKILTLEDPVECEMAGVTQIQVRPKIGLTFANGLRSMLRHDPDVILVGEIRDKETAEMAIHASLTGHLVLSSLHTNNAPGAITRLLDMGIEPFLVTSSLRAVLAQRLVRKLCPDCQEESVADSSSSCVTCDGLGYRGRTAVCELMVCDSTMESAILNGQNAEQVRICAMKQGMRTMFEDGMAKVSQASTSMAELQRVLGEDGKGGVAY